MTVQKPYALQNRVDHSALLFRRALAGVVPVEGVASLDDLVVTQTGTPSMAVSVTAGSCFVDCYSALGGMYHALNDAAVTVPVAAAHASLTRYDLLVLRVQDTSFGAGADDADLFVVQGTPSGSPAEPSLPTGSGVSMLVLARITVPGAASSIVNANITDRRVRAGTMTRPPYLTRLRRTTDINAVTNGTETTPTWESATTPTGYRAMSWAGSGITIPESGVYAVTATTSVVVASSATSNMRLDVKRDGSLVDGGRTLGPMNNLNTQSIQHPMPAVEFDAGDVVTCSGTPYGPNVNFESFDLTVCGPIAGG